MYSDDGDGQPYRGLHNKTWWQTVSPHLYRLGFTTLVVTNIVTLALLAQTASSTNDKFDEFQGGLDELGDGVTGVGVGVETLGKQFTLAEQGDAQRFDLFGQQLALIQSGLGSVMDTLHQIANKTLTE